MSRDALPLTLLVPDDKSPVEIFDSHAALKMAVVERSGASALGDEWNEPGVYILVDRHEADGTWGAYVGKAPAGIKARLGNHLRNKDHWYRAILIRRDTTFGFNSAQVGWLEGRLYELLQAAGEARLHNGNRPSDETLPPYERQSLEMVIIPIKRVLKLIGHDPTTPDDAVTLSANRKARTNRFVGVTLAQIVDAGLVAEGANLVSTNGAWPATAKVGPGGTVKFGSDLYPTPSAAAAAVKGGAANGWDFWAVDDPSGKTPLATLRVRYLELDEAP